MKVAETLSGAERCSKENTWTKRTRRLFLALLAIEFQREDEFLAVVEVRNGAGGGRPAFFFGMNFVAGVQIEAAETELAFLVGNVGCNVLGANVLQIDHRGIDRGFLFVDDRAANGAQF